MPDWDLLEILLLASIIIVVFPFHHLLLEKDCITDHDAWYASNRLASRQEYKVQMQLDRIPTMLTETAFLNPRMNRGRRTLGKLLVSEAMRVCK